jgi:hypothetical protein
VTSDPVTHVTTVLHNGLSQPIPDIGPSFQAGSQQEVSRKPAGIQQEASGKPSGSKQEVTKKPAQPQEDQPGTELTMTCRTTTWQHAKGDNKIVPSSFISITVINNDYYLFDCCVALGMCVSHCLR